jgi:hypothetical protein
MADLPSHPDTDNDNDNDLGPRHGPTTGTPRWLTVLAIIIGVVVVVLLIVLHLTGVVGPGGH